MKPIFLISGTLFAFLSASPAADPTWWTTRGVKSASPASNLSPATIGQAKHMAAMALAELQTQLSPQDYSALQSNVAVVVNLAAPQSQAEFDNQRSVLLTGQLKALAKPFYDKLRTLNAVWLDNEMVFANIRVVEPGSNPISYSPYPWSVATSDDQNKAVATLGQLKAVFSLRFDTFRDADHDGLPDAWELQYFPNLDQTAGGDPDGDGLNNAQECELGFNPLVSDATVDADADGLSNLQEVAIGTDAADPDTDGDQMGDGYEVWHTFSPLVVEINNKGPDGDFDNDGTTNANEALTGRMANLFHESFPAPSPGSGMIARWFGSAGFWYTIQYSTDLINWTTHPMGFMGTNIELSVDVANWYGAPLPPSLFVRLYIGPAATVDMDGDGLGAELEFQLRLDPTKADTDGDGIGDADEDADGDGLSNAAELGAFTSPALADTDGDGLSDWRELNQTASNPTSALDSDGDGIADDWEKWWATQILASGVALTESDLAGLLAGNVEPNREAFGDGTSNAEQFDVAKIAAAKSGGSARAYTVRAKRRAVWGTEMAHEGGTYGGISGLLNGDVRWIGAPSVEPYLPPAYWVMPYPLEINLELSSRAPWEGLPWEGYDIIQMDTESRYQQNSYANGNTETEFLHENHQFKLVFPEISDEARSAKFLKVTTTWGYPVEGTVPIQTAEMVEFVIPANRTTSPQVVEVNPGLVDGKNVNVFLSEVKVVADTNRDGFVNFSDSSGKDQWTKLRGAIYSVNFDRDGNNTHDSNPTADAITWWDTSGVPIHEDWKIENEADKDDLSPFEIAIPNLPQGAKVYLTLAETEDFHAVHIFPRIKAGENAIWGGFGTSGRPWTDGDANPLDIEITKWLKPQPGEDGYVSEFTGPHAGKYTFGLEGLVFRGMSVPGGTEGGKFSGIIELALELQIAGQSERMKFGKVKMKVSPFLLTPNDRPTETVFVRDIKDLMNNPIGLQAMHKSVAISLGLPSNNTSQWLQDHVEIGHTQRPGGPLLKMTFVCPYKGSNEFAKWPRTHLLKPGKGIFALGGNSNGNDGGDFGGNIELSRPQENYPLGRVLAGDAMSANLRAFLEAQEVQTPVVSNISYTEIQHIDEVLSPGPNNTTYVPGPAGAILLLQEKFDTEEKQVRGVLFSPDNVQPTVAKVWKSATAASTPFIITDQNYDDVINEWSRFNRTEGNPQGGYLRLVGGVSGGQIAVIKAVTKAVQVDGSRIGFAGNPEGKLMIEVEYYYDTGSKALSNWKAIKPHRANSWYRKPLEGAYVVCVQKTLRWASTTPALMTVKEILEDQDFLDFNHTTLPPLIAATANASGIDNPVKIPCLFYERVTKRGDSPVAIAYTPNTANLQWVDSNPVNAKPFGPRNAANADVLEEGIQVVLPGQSMFLDDWSSFHIQSGEVHCGSAAERVAAGEWWKK